MTSPAIILLAAGSSSRMGQSKQLIKIKEESLLVHSLNQAIQSGMPTFVVLGANTKKHRAAIENIPVDIVENVHWETGMGSSLKTGLRYVLQKAPNTEAIIVMVCDQPLLTSEHLLKIKSLYEKTHKPIIASYYSNTAGVPALFHKTLFNEILTMSDDQGAKKIILSHKDKTVTMDFPDGAIDLDTPEDLKKIS
jgi:molybdenum cofactor cytidylyltransferase